MSSHSSHIFITDTPVTRSHKKGRAMSTMHKVKAYFGMAPMDDYDDEYYEDDDRGTTSRYTRRPREDRFEDDGYGPGHRAGYEDREYEDAPAGYRGGYREDDRFEPRPRAPREFERASSRLGALRGLSLIHI